MNKIIISLIILFFAALGARAIPAKNSHMYFAPIGSQVFINGDHAGATEDLVVNGSIFAASSINGNSLIINGATLITTASDFFKNGASNGAANRSLGNLDDQGLSLMTNGVMAISMDDNGLVGIGFESPSATLNVNGDLITNSNITFNGAVANTGALSMNGAIAIAEGAAPSSGTASYGKLYVDSGDNKIYFKDSSGTAIDLLAPAGGGVASESLNNLAAVAINQSLISDTNNIDDLGSSTKGWKDLWLSGEAYLGQYLYHDNDTDTLIKYSTNGMTVNAGGEMFINITENNSQDLIELGDDGDIDIKLSAGADAALFINGSSAQIGIGTTNTNEALTVQGIISFKALSAAPDNGDDFGKIYVNGTSSNICYIDSSGTETDLVNGDGSVTTKLDDLSDAIVSGADNSVYLGSGAGKVSVSSIANTALGRNSLNVINAGDNNTSIGYNSAKLITSGNGNIAVGYKAGDNLTTGNGNLIIGNDIDAPSASGSNQLNIANLIFGTSIDETGTNISDGNIGIGIANPSSRLDISGSLRANGAVALGNTLTVTSTSTLTDDVNMGAELAINGATASAGALALNGALAFEETATAPALTSGYGKIYVKTDHKAYFKDQDGTETNLITGNSAINDLTDAIVSGSSTSIYWGDNGGAVLAGATINTSVGINGLAAIENTATQNTALGYNTLQSNTSGYNNTAIAAVSMSSNTTGYNNSSVGYNTLSTNSSANGNSAFGETALRDNSTGARNTALGRYVLLENTTGNNNTGIGLASLQVNSSGSKNTGVGDNSLRYNTSGTSNLGIGSWANYYNTSGSYNTSVGYTALSSNTTASNSSCAGYQCLVISTGTSNIALGYNAASTTIAGTNNIIIGANVNAPAANSNYKLNIGNTIYGDLSTDYLGISDTNPDRALDVNGSAIFNGGLTVTGTSTLAALSATSGSFTTLASSGNFTINNSSKFQVLAASGNTAIGGTLNTTGATTLSSFSATSATINGNITSVNNIAITTLSSENGDNGEAINIDLGSDPGDDFTIDTTKLVVEGDTGDVGINKAEPTTALDVVGSGFISNNLTVMGDLLIKDSSVSAALNINNNNGSFLFNGSTVGATSYKTTFQMDDTALSIGHDHNSRKLNLKTNSTTRLSLSANNGDIGIGTSDPASQLNVISSIDKDVLWLSDDGGTSGCEANPGASMTWVCNSDARLKKDIKNSAAILPDLIKFKIKDFTMINSGERATGVIAQEVQEDFPEMVSMGDNAYLRVDNLNQWQLVQALQELKNRNNLLKNIICKDHQDEVVCKDYKASLEQIRLDT